MLRDSGRVARAQQRDRAALGQRLQELRTEMLREHGLVAGISGPAVIDEIQRAPGLLLAIKQRLDSDDIACEEAGPPAGTAFLKLGIAAGGQHRGDCAAADRSAGDLREAAAEEIIDERLVMAVQLALGERPEIEVFDASWETLEDLFLVRQLRPWHTNLGSRQIKSPKLHIVDSGLLAYLIGANEQRITDDGDLTGPLLESFVAMELLRQADWAQEPVHLFHYRDQQQREVDVILERHSGEIVGVEVKAGATPAARDFAGLRYLRDKLGARFKAGVVLHTGADTLPFGDRLAAVPVSGLWH